MLKNEVLKAIDQKIAGLEHNAENVSSVAHSHSFRLAASELKIVRGWVESILLGSCLQTANAEFIVAEKWLQRIGNAFREAKKARKAAIPELVADMLDEKPTDPQF